MNDVKKSEDNLAKASSLDNGVIEGKAQPWEAPTMIRMGGENTKGKLADNTDEIGDTIGAS